jgi:hypothetical protein
MIIPIENNINPKIRLNITRLIPRIDVQIPSITITNTLIYLSKLMVLVFNSYFFKPDFFVLLGFSIFR